MSKEKSDAGKRPSLQEFSIRVPKTQKKKHHVMRFNATLNVDFAQWKVVKLERENNMREFKSFDEDQPKFGAGSEYNRDNREEARKKKFGIISKKYRADQQPWILKVGGKSGKKFKGIREGGVGENASFYVFTHAPDGTIEAYPLNEWYNFQPINRYKSLTAEEAEQEFGRRKKVMNYFSLMLRKRLKGDDTEEILDEDVKSKISGKKSKELKISDMDEWIDESDNDSDSDDSAEKKDKNNDSDDGDDKKSKNKKGANVKKEKKKRDVNDEAFEESDDGDEEGREMDYDTESSEDIADPEDKMNKELKSVAEEDALRKLLSSDEDDEEENKSENDSEKEEKKNKEKEEAKDKKKNKKNKQAKKDSSSESSMDSSDSDSESAKKKVVAKESLLRSATPTESNKRKIMNNMPSDLNMSDNSNSPLNTPAKRSKAENSTVPTSFTGMVNSNIKDSDCGITEEAVRRYLMRKPMTATELLTKFKNKKTGLSSERLVETMTQILKRISPTKQTIQGKMYLSISQGK